MRIISGYSSAQRAEKADIRHDTVRSVTGAMANGPRSCAHAPNCTNRPKSLLFCQNRASNAASLQDYSIELFVFQEKNHGISLHTSKNAPAFL